MHSSSLSVQILLQELEILPSDSRDCSQSSLRPQFLRGVLPGGTPTVCNDEVVTGGSSDTLGSPKGTFSLQAVSERYDTGLRPSES